MRNHSFIKSIKSVKLKEKYKLGINFLIKKNIEKILHKLQFKKAIIAYLKVLIVIKLCI